MPPLEEITTEADKVKFGVSKPSQTDATGQILPKSVEIFTLFGVTYKVRRHPDLLRMKHIDLWVKDYEYLQEFTTHVPTDERHLCWLELREQYNATVRGFENERYPNS